MGNRGLLNLKRGLQPRRMMISKNYRGQLNRGIIEKEAVVKLSGNTLSQSNISRPIAQQPS